MNYDIYRITFNQNQEAEIEVQMLKKALKALSVIVTLILMFPLKYPGHNKK